MKVTKQQFVKWNEQLGNGWSLDLQDLVVWGNKTPRIFDEISETEKVEYYLHFSDVVVDYICTGHYDIKLTKRVWTKSSTSDCWTSHGLGCTKIIEHSATDKKTYKILADYTKTHTLEDVKALFTGNEVNPLA